MVRTIGHSGSLISAVTNAVVAIFSAELKTIANIVLNDKTAVATVHNKDMTGRKVVADNKVAAPLLKISPAQKPLYDNKVSGLCVSSSTTEKDSNAAVIKKSGLSASRWAPANRPHITQAPRGLAKSIWVHKARRGGRITQWWTNI